MAPVASYNQPLTPEDAIMTPSGGYVDRRWLLDGGGGGNAEARYMETTQVPPSGTSTASGSSKTKSFRLWRTVLKRCKKIGGKGSKEASNTAPPWPAPPPRCVLERVASASESEELILTEDETVAIRKCSYHSELKTSKVQFCRFNCAVCKGGFIGVGLI